MTIRLRTAVVGVGYLGRFHAHKYAAIEGVELAGVCDVDAAAGRAVAEELGTRYVADYRELDDVDAVTIATDTAAHAAVARHFLERGVHVLIEKPMTRTSAEAAELTRLAGARGLKLQIGHIERFNPALVAAREGLDAVRFIECHRLAPYKARGVDVNVVLDLMIHDLDVILSLVDSKPASVSAVGIGVISDNVDIANARIEFENGATANVTASRVSTSAQRKFRVFQQREYVSIDFGEGRVQRVTCDPNDTSGNPLTEREWNLEKGDALLVEVQSFVDAIADDTSCLVTGEDGRAALELAETIMAGIDRRREQFDA